MTDDKYKEMSKAEREVAKYFDKLNIKWDYEKSLIIFDDKNRIRIWSPDFYLKDINIFIEVCGNEGFDYEYREKIYKKNNIPIIFIHYYKNEKLWKSYLFNKLFEIFPPVEMNFKEIINAINDDIHTN